MPASWQKVIFTDYNWLEVNQKQMKQISRISKSKL